MKPQFAFALTVLAAVCGFYVGRIYPAHHYEVLPNRGGLLMDTATGKVCNPFWDAQRLAYQANTIISKLSADQPLTDQEKAQATNPMTYIPQCGNE